MGTEARLARAAALDVSEATIRRDFADLDARRLVQRNHGGIVAASVAYELPYRYRVSHGDAALERIGAAAAALVQPGEVVVLNGGTTTTATARALAARDDLTDTTPPLTVVTNALNIAGELVLRNHLRCISLGGVARPDSYEVSGRLAALAIQELWFDTAVIGVDGISAAAGATCRHDDEAAVVRLMVERAQRVVIVAARAKLGRNALATMCPVDRIDVLVSDADPGDPHVVELREVGVELLLVEPPPGDAEPVTDMVDP